MRSLMARIMFTFTFIAVFSIVIVSIVINRVIADQFADYLMHGPMAGSAHPGSPQLGARLMLHMLSGPLEQSFIQSVNKSTWITALITAALAALVGVLFARKITAPIKELSKAARKISGGDLSQRVTVNSNDEIGELGKAFNTMSTSIEKNIQLKHRLMVDVVHEIKTPLTVIQGNLEAMLDGVIEPTPKKIAAIHTETLLLARLLNDLRDATLAQENELDLQRELQNIGPIARQVVEMFEPRAREEQKNLEARIPDGLPDSFIDQQRISQVLYNLLNNALKYTGEGDSIKIDVHIDTEINGTGKPVILVTISDTGTGISDEDLPHVFDHFYRVDESRARISGGSGIGLAIVKHLVEAHGGIVWAKSELGVGSSFFFTIPLNVNAG
jgi:two-component system sensor histidine kinase BaeS